MSWLYLPPYTRRDREFEAEARRLKGKFVPLILNEFQGLVDDNSGLPFLVYDGSIIKRKPRSEYEMMVVMAMGMASYFSGIKGRRTPIPNRIKRELLQQRGTLCEACKDSEDHHIHHVDGDPNNNTIENLVMLCVNCHKEEHRKKKRAK